jgi:hypothetical protein
MWRRRCLVAPAVSGRADVGAHPWGGRCRGRAGCRPHREVRRLRHRRGVQRRRWCRAGARRIDALGLRHRFGRGLGLAIMPGTWDRLRVADFGAARAMPSWPQEPGRSGRPHALLRRRRRRHSGRHRNPASRSRPRGMFDLDGALLNLGRVAGRQLRQPRPHRCLRHRAQSLHRLCAHTHRHLGRDRKPLGRPQRAVFRRRPWRRDAGPVRCAMQREAGPTMAPCSSPTPGSTPSPSRRCC